MAADSHVITHVEVNSPTPNDQAHRKTTSNGVAANTANAGSNYGFQSLGRQSSIYSLTLDEFQQSLCDAGKNFGSMNMDEFLNSIWTAEENQQHATNGSGGATTNTSYHQLKEVNSNASAVNGNNLMTTGAGASGGGGLVSQPSLVRQGSLTLPAPLCRKTVDEVWSEIQGTQHQDPQQVQEANHNKTNCNNANGIAAGWNTNGTQRQQTFGEMTLEDFLIKAGVVQEQGSAPMSANVRPPPQPPQQPEQHYGLYQNNNPPVGPPFVRPIMAMPPGAVATSFQPMPPQNNASAGGTVGEPPGYVAATNGKRIDRYAPAPAPAQPPPGALVYGGRVGNGAVPVPTGYGAAGLGMASPVSPVSSDGMGLPGQVDNSVGQYGLDVGVLRGRKRGIDGPVEKVVERRQRRMIKNRESAARSRARKQAYTVELEAELNQLREENDQLKQALAELEKRDNQQHVEREVKQVVPSRAQKAQDKLRLMRRTRSCQI